MWTTHGHQIIGTIAEDPVIGQRPSVRRCGGPGTCKACDTEVTQIQKSLGLDEFGRKVEKEGT